MTDPGYPTEVPEADRAEQEGLLPDDVVPGAGLPDEAPEADVMEQRLATVPDEAGVASSVGDREADPVDVLEQETVVPADEEDVPG